MTLSPKLGVVGISTLWHFRLPLPIQMFIKVASSPRLSGIGMPSPILWSHPLKMQRIVLLSSLLWWELGTNSLITGPGEWLSFRRFTSKLSWSWSWSCRNMGRVKRICVFEHSWSWKILTAHAQSFRGARDLAFCLKVPLDSLLVWASSWDSGEAQDRPNLRCSHRW